MSLIKNRVLEAFGELITLTDAAKKYNISRGCLTARLRKMSAEEALSTLLKKRRPRQS